MKNICFDFFGCLQKRQPFFFALLLILLVGCNGKSEEDNDDFELLFEVNGIERTISDFEAAYVDHLIKTGRNDTRQERYAYLNQMIDNLLLAEAGTDDGLLDHPTYLGGITYQQRKSMVDFFFIDEMDKLLEPLTDEEIRLAYAKRQRKVYVRQLYSQDPRELEIPYQKLVSGESFVDVANDFYETEEYDSLAGFIGHISYFGVDDAFAEAVYSTNQNEFTEPVRTRYGYHIIYVEYIEFPAILAEDEYQYRKQGVRSQLRLRKQQLVSNDYVRTLMEGLNVEADRENLTALRDVIENLDAEAIINSNQNSESISENNWTDDRIERLATAFDQETVMATYEKDGEQVDFTFGDYLKWLPYLSFQESKTRIGASIGRGLRNEVIYQLAAEGNYDNDDRVVKDIQKRGYDILAELHQYNLVKGALIDTSKVDVPSSFRSRLINDRNVVMKAEYWKIQAIDVNEAESIKNEIYSGDPAISFDSYSKVEFSSINPSDNDYRMVEQSLLNTPIIGHSASEGWMVINVLRRELTEVSTSTSVTDLQTSYKVYTVLKAELDRLRESASIEVDTLLFDDIYEVWKDRKEESEE